MEARIISILGAGGVLPGDFEGLLLGRPLGEVRLGLWLAFKDLALDPSLVPAGMSLEDIASLFDQLIVLAEADSASVRDGGAILLGWESEVGGD